MSFHEILIWIMGGFSVLGAISCAHPPKIGKDRIRDITIAIDFFICTTFGLGFLPKIPPFFEFFQVTLPVCIRSGRDKTAKIIIIILARYPKEGIGLAIA